MPHLRPFRLVWVLACCCAAFAGVSCSDSNDDAVGRACKTIVGCNASGTMGDCLDAIGGLTLDCLDCFSEEGCDYSSCQRIPGCRVPPSLVQ